MKLIYSLDFLTHGSTVNLAPHIFNSLILESMKIAGIEPIRLQDLGFDRDVFFGLSNIKPTERYFFFDEWLNSYSIEYLSSYVKDEIILIFEAQEKTKNILNKLQVSYINVWIHPYKLFDDLAFVFETNNSAIEDRLRQFKINQEEFKLYTAYWKDRISFLDDFQKLTKNLQNNSLLLIGQTETDKSIERNGIMLSYADFSLTIDAYKKQYTKIYYRPHPHFYREKNKFPKLQEFLKKNPDIELVDIPTYYLLAAPQIKKVVAISSSVLFEAQYFGKEVAYLYKPLFDANIGIINNQYSPYFWGYIIRGVASYDFTFSDAKNKIRNLIPSEGYWGYGELDNEKILLDFKTKVRKKLRRFPFNLFQRKIKL